MLGLRRNQSLAERQYLMRRARKEIKRERKWVLGFVTVPTSRYTELLAKEYLADIYLGKAM